MSEELKPHELREFVNALTAVAKKYAGTEQLRAQIAELVCETLESRAPVAAVGAEPVAWQYRWFKWPQGHWETCTKQEYEDLRSGYEGRVLYTAPAVAGVPEGYEAARAAYVELTNSVEFEDGDARYVASSKVMEALDRFFAAPAASPAPAVDDGATVEALRAENKMLWGAGNSHLHRLEAIRIQYEALQSQLAASRQRVRELEGPLTELVAACRQMPDGPLGHGLTNGHFLRAERALSGATPAPAVSAERVAEDIASFVESEGPHIHGSQCGEEECQRVCNKYAVLCGELDCKAIAQAIRERAAIAKQGEAQDEANS